MIKRDSSALLLGDKLFITVCRSTESIPAPTDQTFELNINDNHCLIGKKIREALFLFNFDKVRYGKNDWNNIYEPLLIRTQHKSKKKLFDKVKMVNIFSRDSNLFLLPYKNMGYNKIGTKSLDDKMISANLETISDCDLGLALLKAFEVSTLEV